MQPDQLEYARQLLFFSSILAGFAVATAAQIISAASKPKVATYAAGAYIVSAAFSLLATFGYVFVLITAAGAPGLQPPPVGPLIAVSVPLGFLLTVGLVSFLVGIALTGWIHSRSLGILSTVTTALCFLGMLAFALHLASL